METVQIKSNLSKCSLSLLGVRLDGTILDVRWSKASLRSMLAELQNGVVQVLFKASEEFLVMGSIPLDVSLQVHLLSPLLVVRALVQVLLEVAHLVYLGLLPEASGRATVGCLRHGVH